MRSLVLGPNAFPYAVWIALLSFAFHWHAVYPGQYLWPALMMAVVGSTLMPLAWLLSRPYNRMKRWVIDTLERQQNERVSRLPSESAVPPVPLLCLPVPADEAYWYLRLLHMTALLLLERPK